MSEYNVVQLDWKDPGCLKGALKELGYVYEDHKQAQHLHGFQGDERSQMANIIVRRGAGKGNFGGSSNDLGFLKKADGTYEMIISKFDVGARSKRMSQLKQLYGKHVALKQLKKLGCKSIKTTIDKDGRLKIRAIH